MTPIDLSSPGDLAEPTDPVLGPFVRGAVLDGVLYLLDPIPGRWQPYSTAPATSWAAVRNGIYTIGTGSEGSAAIDLVGTDFSRTLETSEWGVPLLVSAIGDLAVAIADATGPSGAAVLGIDPTTGSISWTWSEHQSEDEVPLFAFVNPAHDRIVVLLGSPSTQEVTAHVILGPEGEEVTGWPEQSRFLPPNSFVIGWFDADSLLYSIPPGPGLFTFDLDTFESTPLAMANEVEPGTVLWPVGDGRHLVALSGEGLLLLDTVGGETRPLAIGCAVAAVGDAGGLTG